MEEVYSILDTGCKRRRKAATLLNKSSSRSHTLFTVSVKNIIASSTIKKVNLGKLNLVSISVITLIFACELLAVEDS